MRLRTRCLSFVATLAALWCAGAGVAAAEPAEAVDFNRDVRPILSRNCFACHGQDEGSRQAGLRLDQREAATVALDSGLTAVVPKKPDDSELLVRVAAEDEFLRMPPLETGHELSADEVATLRRWIAEGAVYAEHWSFVPPRPAAPPGVVDATWPRGAIDRFVLSRLEQKELQPAREADRHALARRLSLDLRGLPPTPEEVSQFVADSSADAYERLVDRFLADAAFGERWARMWLDLSRYADSAGYGSDPLRTIWRYRDWVISAFNQNLPYDEFTIQQLAGDLVERPTLDTQLATAFHRNTKTNTEGGTDDEEFRVEAVRDRVDTTMQVWMGLTMGCAKCHTHKYDPFTQEEYYRLFAFFNQTADADRPDETPLIDAPTEDILEKRSAIDRAIARVERRLDAPHPELAEAQAEWERSLAPTDAWRHVDHQADPRAADDSSAGILRFITRLDAAQTITGLRIETAGRPNDGLRVEPHPARGLTVRQVRATIERDEAKPALARFVRIELPGKRKLLSLAEVQVISAGENIAPRGQASQSSTAFQGEAHRAIDGNTSGDYFESLSVTHTLAEDSPWWELDLADERPIDRIMVWNRTDNDTGSRLAGARVVLLDASREAVAGWPIDPAPAPSAQWMIVGPNAVRFALASADFSAEGFEPSTLIAGAPSKQGGWRIEPSDEPHALTLVSAEPIVVDQGATLTIELALAAQAAADDAMSFRFSTTADLHLGERSKLPREVAAALDRPLADRNQSQVERLASHYRSIAPALKPLRDRIGKLEKSKPTIPTIPVMAELPVDQQRVTRILVRGSFLDPGDEVSLGVPSALHAWPASAPESRLGLAQWLVSRDNPLTARVAVNRLWAQLFGRGLVETEEDFGTQGALPSHPELLDWLACQYMANGWDTKALLKTIVMSATYRQASHVDAAALERDPSNRWLARGPRFRMEAEMVRDQALALSGLLVRKLGGPSVFPPQPDGMWQAAFNGRDRSWTTNTDEDRYRRGLYTFWRRSVPYPSMATFDAPSRETCAIRRTRTNTPLQALVTLNDEPFIEAAQALARRIVREGGSTVEDRVSYALELCLSRPASSEQASHLAALYHSELAHYQSHEKAAEALATAPLGPLPDGWSPAELAAWTVVANVLLNLDGVLTRG